MKAIDLRVPLDLPAVSGLLAAQGWTGPLPCVAESSDIMAAAEDLVRRGAPEWTAVVAEDPAGSAWPGPAPARGLLQVAVIVRPAPAGQAWTVLAAALALRDAIRAAGGIPAELEWPGDLVVPSAMCGGAGGSRVLGRVTVRTTGELALVDLVAAVALNSLELPAPGMTSVYAEGGRPDRAGILAGLLPALQARLEQCRRDPASLRQDYQRACRTIGRLVPAGGVDGTRGSGVVTGIDAEGRLVLAETPGRGTASA